MKFPNDVTALLAKKFNKSQKEWLHPQSTSCWPLEITLNIPTESAAMQQIKTVREWITSWQTWQGHGKLHWRERRWQTLGLQQVPHKLILQTPEEVAHWIGQFSRFQLAKSRYEYCLNRWPQCHAADLARHVNLFADYSHEDFQRLLGLLEWLMAHPHSHLYPRQLPVPGIDSKWLEHRKAIVADFLVAIQFTTDRDCGLKVPPSLLRFRLLDAKLRYWVGGLSDITTPWEDALQLQLPVTSVLIIENLQTGLAMTDLPGTLLIMGLGYHLDKIADLSMLAQAKIYYWGDIDTHGFAMLSRLRKHLPDTQSLLMDEATLLNHHSLWGTEARQHAAESLPHLTTTEQFLYQRLKQHHWQANLRLEQERINWQDAMSTITTVLESLGSKAS